MQALIGFLTSDDTFVAAIPDEEYLGPSARSVVNLGWTKSSVVHLPPGIPAIGGDDFQLVRQVYAGDTPVQVFVRDEGDPDNDITVLSWLLPSGQLCTHLPSALGPQAMDGMGTLLTSMLVVVDEHGLPRLSFELPLTGGDPRIPIEQDDVSFISSSETIPDLAFSMSGAMSGTTTTQDADHVEVSIALGLGITVKCAAPLTTDYQLVQMTASSVAASVTKIVSV